MSEGQQDGQSSPGQKPGEAPPPKFKPDPGKDFYGILGLPRDATPDEIKRAHRKLARELHPDHNPGDKDAEERFKAVSVANDVLSDEKKRKEYDEVLPPLPVEDADFEQVQSPVADTDSEHKQNGGDPGYTEDPETRWRRKEAARAKADLDVLRNESIEREKADLRRKAHVRRQKAEAAAAQNRADALKRTKENSERQRIEQEYAHAMKQAQYTFDSKMYFEEAATEKGIIDRESIAGLATKLEKEVQAQASVEPRSYRLGGKYLRVSYGTQRREIDGSEEHVTTAEWIAPAPDEDGNYRSEGMIIIREESTGDIWLQRITRSYRARTFKPIPESYAFVFNSGAIEKGEIKEIRASLEAVTTNPPV